VPRLNGFELPHRKGRFIALKGGSVGLAETGGDPNHLKTRAFPKTEVLGMPHQKARSTGSEVSTPTGILKILIRSGA
jgi:hypothetical protein